MTTDPLDILEARREELGWSTAQLARAAGMRDCHIYEWKNGSRALSMRNFRRLADAMGGLRGADWGDPPGPPGPPERP